MAMLNSEISLRKALEHGKNIDYNKLAEILYAFTSDSLKSNRNRYMMNSLNNNNIDPDSIRDETTMRIIAKWDRVIAAEDKVGLIVTIIHNNLIDIARKEAKYCNTYCTQDEYTWDCMVGDTPLIEEDHLIQETVSEIISLLSGISGFEAIALLSSVCQIKPKALASIILSVGYENAVHEVLREASFKLRVPLHRLTQVTSEQTLKNELSNDITKLSRAITLAKSRAAGKLKKKYEQVYDEYTR